MKTNTWVNPTKPITGAMPYPICPLCGGRINGPYPSYDENNHVVQKTGCIKCSYVAQLTTGFSTMKDADTAVFK